MFTNEENQNEWTKEKKNSGLLKPAKILPFGFFDYKKDGKLENYLRKKRIKVVWFDKEENFFIWGELGVLHDTSSMVKLIEEIVKNPKRFRKAHKKK